MNTCKNCKHYNPTSLKKNYGYGSCGMVTTQDGNISLSPESDAHLKEFGYNRAWHEKFESIRYDENKYDKTISVSRNQITEWTPSDGEVSVGEDFGCIHFENKD